MYLLAQKITVGSFWNSICNVQIIQGLSGKFKDNSDDIENYIKTFSIFKSLNTKRTQTF